ncbi:Fic family protein [Tsukamurella spumae]|uniref:Fic family protein n=1 Tax=Tsukamurella spumae TaxID=44753 RepID=A0A846WVX6_9ACTN|nr:Fic family protein [Tsukamurella spumae]NKY17277.1 Fic family protein [Tsukamurella spumae]
MTAITVTDLAGVVYSSGKVFDGLSTGRLDTEDFLRSGSVEGITSRADLALLEDLRDAAAFILDGAARRTDAALVRDINARITRSGALHPGELRTAEQRIGVRTRYGRHSPEALTDEGLRNLVETLTAGTDPIESALSLFVGVARAQPFEDGNKRTALFAANHLLLGAGTGLLLVVPVSDTDPTVADAFNDLLARAYLFGEDDGVKNLLRRDGIVRIGA